MDKTNKLVIVDQILAQLEAAKSGIVEGSVCMASVNAIDNVASNVVQHRISDTTGGSYMTFPLSPIVKCCSIDKSYLNLEFQIDMNVKIEAPTGTSADFEADFPFYIGFRDTNTIFNQVQLMIENTPIYTDSYNRENATFLYCSQPEGVIRDNNQYASIDKMRNGDKSPMKRVVVHCKYLNATTKTLIARLSLPIRATVDISRMPQVILSNLHYTTPHFGNLRLRVFIQAIQQALLFCPDYTWMTTKGANAGESLTPFTNQYWTYYSFAEFAGKKIESTKIPFYGYVKTTDYVCLSGGVTFSDPLEIAAADSMTGSKIDQADFMTFYNGVAEMVQTCFDIKGEEYEQLTKYFEEMGSIIIPTQVLSCSVFNNSSIIGEQPASTLIANVGSYNINDICVYFHDRDCPVMFNNEALSNFQLLLDGRPINNLPYSYLNDKAITQMTQSIIDTDHEDINRDYMRSLAFLNQNESITYLDTALSTQLGAPSLGNSIHRCALYNPGLCAYVFNCNLEDAFHSGWACLETATRNAVLRLDSSNAQKGAPFSNMTERAKFPYYKTCNLEGTSTIAGFICFCDTCLVLDYDRARGVATGGSLSNSAPYI